MKTFLLFVALICATTTATPIGNGESLNQKLDELLALVQRMPTCGCDVTGSSSLQCAVSTGLCTCKAGYTGRTCNSCATNYFRTSGGACEACGCDSNGSSSLQCADSTGICTCKATYKGTKCDSSPRILVVTGRGYGGFRKQTELWPKTDSQCTLPNFPLEIYGAVGFWTAQGPTVCGGSDGENRTNKCFIFKNQQWMAWTNMGTARQWASALQINPNQALIIGGIDENYYSLKTTELYSSSGSEEGNKFPVTIYGHCSFPFNATHGIVTGGFQDGHYTSANTWFVDLTTTKVAPGPTMKTKRGYHGCSIFQHGTKSYGIVSGGKNWGMFDSTEMIHFDQESPTWTEGPKLPRKLLYLTLVQTSQGTYAMGGFDEDYNARNEVLQLDCPGDQISSCQWKQVGNLQFSRYKHVSIALPESYDICRA